ncbi:autotransporter domain-containing protein [Rhizobium sp. S95]|uniref:Autotransporter domain-containing protein n=1 Tax=Ciceribacter sichuanensis TaxID=2949647 RepID=A0AAJ1FH88_9HYPH|nr:MULTISPECIES: autotransporter domain-containing protein [unclassified Ciceribacter]MCM2395264.1 autotransporter domain-containing protein [Ciceribacter sp. S95]MCO5955686.1 autotransporter domain-containing protein [Ciceribacter sp. S101]
MFMQKPARRRTKINLASLCGTSALAMVLAMQAHKANADDGGFRDVSNDLSVALINRSNGSYTVARIVNTGSLLAYDTSGYVTYNENAATTVVSTGFTTRGNALSGDGSVMVGYARFVADGDYQAFIWSAANGITNIGALASGESQAIAVSDNGMAVVGNAEFGGNYDHAFYWSDGASTLRDLGTLGGDRSNAYAISADGSTVVGSSYLGTTPEASHGFVWHVGDAGMTDIGVLATGTYSEASLVSNNGLVVAGSADVTESDGNSTSYYSRAIRWTDAGGIIDLGTLGGKQSSIAAMSNDGTVIVGDADMAPDINTDDTYSHAYRWEVGSDGINGTMTDLGTLGGNSSYAYDVNADGTVVVGYAKDSADDNHGFRWTQTDGMITVEQWLRNNGVTVDDNFTSDALKVSDDGNVVAGYARNNHYYIARVATPEAPETPTSGIIDLPQYLNTIGSTAAPRVGQPIASANTIMFGAQGSPMRDLLKTGQRSIWGTADTGYDNSDASDGGLVLGDFGFGYGIADGITARISAGGTYTDQDLDAGGDFQHKGWYVSPEVSANIAGDIYLTVGGYYSRGKLDIKRGYLNGSAMDYSYGDTDTETWAGKIRVDWLNAFTLGDSAFTPYAALSRANTKSDGYTETGGSFPAIYDESEDHSTIARVGIDLVHTLTDDIRLLGRAEADYRFEKETTGTSGEIIGISSFDLEGQDVKQFWVRAGIGAEFDVGGGTASLMVNATTEGDDPNVWLRSGWKVNF